MTSSLRMAVMRALQSGKGYDFARDTAGSLTTRIGGHGAAADVVATARGIQLDSAVGGFHLTVETTSVGRRTSPRSLDVLFQSAEGQELVLDREDDVEERYLAGPLGLEQTYLVRARPEGRGPLVIAVAFEGLTLSKAEGTSDQVLLRDASGIVRAGYRDLAAVDAAGRELPSRMEVGRTSVALEIDDTGAEYPLHVDPLVWVKQAELLASDGQPFDEFGNAVAVSGGTAIVGAPQTDVGGVSYNQGTAYVFVQSGATWIQQAELKASGGVAGENFGRSVALSGGTALVGANGAAYFFVHSGVSTWTQQYAVGDGGTDDSFGSSVGLNEDSTLAIVGAYGHTVGSGSSAHLGQGAAFVYVYGNNNTWGLQAEITSSDGNANDNFGAAVALSGETAIAGAASHAYAGAAYVFVQTLVGSSFTWPQQAELTASDRANQDSFGISVGVSGGTAIVGASGHQVGVNAWQGAAYVFTQSGTSWTQQAELAASDGAANDQFGGSVAVSGGTAVVGDEYHTIGSNTDQGAAYVFVQSGITWTQQAEVAASDGNANDDFGMCVAVSGSTVAVGAPKHHYSWGAAYVFVSADGNGTPCSAGTAKSCATSNCVDGVCCDTPCGGGVATDCVSCLGAMTGGSDGTCGAVTASADYTCRAATGPCDVAGVCMGASASCPTDSAQPNGTSCGTSVICVGGTCGSDCFIGGVLYSATQVNPGNACQVCTPTTSTTAWSNASDGASCNDGNACDLIDTCLSGICTAGSHVTCTAPDSCHTAGTCSSASGLCSAPTLDAGFCSISGACVASGAVNGANTCETCQPGVSTSVYSQLANGTVCGTNQVCVSGTCSNDCFIGGVLYPSGAINPTNACQICTPATSTTAWSSVSDGTGCNDNNACTQIDTCQSGTCVGTIPVICTASDQCHGVGTCDTSTGACSNPTVADGTTCTGANACYQTNSCQAGTCTGSNAVTCTAEDQCHAAGVCSPSTGTCSQPARANGTSCNDANSNTVNDVCTGGVCAGTDFCIGVTCSASDQCHVAGVCDHATGMCSNPTATNGTTCDDGNACTQTDSCQAGSCTSSNPVICTAEDQCHAAGVCSASTGTCSQPALANGTSCNDANPNTVNDVCTDGVCAGTDFCIGVTCSASDQCHVAGSCNHATGVCSIPITTNGTACDDGNACTQTDSCQAGTCVGGNPIRCTASDQCHAVGSCDPTTGACSSPSVADGTSCDDDNACTQIDACQSGTCTGSDPVVCTNGDQCNGPGTCRPATGTCSAPVPLGDGTACDDGNPCDLNDACRAGVCLATGTVACVAADPCHLPGTCNASTGQCSKPLVADGTACAGGTCEGGVCVPPASDSGTDSGADSGSSNDGSSDAAVDGDSDASSAADTEMDSRDTGSADSSSVSDSVDSDTSDAAFGADADSSSESDAGMDSGGTGSADASSDASSDTADSSTDQGDAGSSEPLADGGTGGTQAASGCGCRVTSAPAPMRSEGWPLLVLGLLVARRSRLGERRTS
ncbi:MAG: hypothetical protein ACHREM_09200 [Polyangiales bacterium]